MIRTYADKDTEALALGERVRRWINIESVARRKLAQLNAAATLDFLRVPPGNRLEVLGETGRANGVSASTISSAFASVGLAATTYDVEITDYH